MKPAGDTVTIDQFPEHHVTFTIRMSRRLRLRALVGSALLRAGSWVLGGSASFEIEAR